MFKLFALVFAAILAVVCAKPGYSVAPAAVAYAAPAHYGYGYTGYPNVYRAGYVSPYAYSAGYVSPYAYNGYNAYNGYTGFYGAKYAAPSRYYY